MEKKKVKRKFHPTIIPRYLPGQVSPPELTKDLVEYNKHRYRVFTAEPTIDCHPLKMNPYMIFDSKKLLADAQRLMQIDKENKQLLQKIITINRTGGKVDTYNPVAYRQIDRWAGYNLHIREIEAKNRKFYSQLQAIRSHYNNELLESDWQRTLEQIKHSVRFPILLLQKADIDKELKACKSISGGLQKGRPCLRPLSYLTFKVKSTDCCLGKIIIELYHDFVPVTVQNFLELCRGSHVMANGAKLTYKNCLVHRIIKGQYMESGDITKGTGRGGLSIYGKSFPEENHMLQHSKTGVISMKRVDWTENNSQFTITFTKVVTLDNKNVVFGHVVKGNNVLLKIQGYGRKIGKPLMEIIISDCGEYIPKRQRDPCMCYEKPCVEDSEGENYVESLEEEGDI